MSYYNINSGETITIARNVGFQLPVLFKVPVGTPPGVLPVTPNSISGYSLAFIIGTSPGLNATQAGQFGDPVYTNTNPVVTEPGMAVFQMGWTDTASLVIGITYQYAILYQSPGENPTLCRFGLVTLLDSPALSGLPDELSGGGNIAATVKIIMRDKLPLAYWMGLDAYEKD